ncbi:YlcI/YnfO family protein [Dyella sp. 2RAB6]|uniref:YlcI/YnfO family protein n=1 Tax=Dyella sp. 2RAB6 TaxID=3232992 RepID=UPI003F8FFD3B
MKTAVIPPLRVDPAFREQVLGVLRPGESLSAFTEASLRAEIHRRTAQREFIARGRASAERAHRSGRHVEADDMLSELAALLEASPRCEGDE